jgi:hypothetical protein
MNAKSGRGVELVDRSRSPLLFALLSLTLMLRGPYPRVTRMLF